jgi:hypothetical protein
MILDRQNLVSDAQFINTGNIVSTDAIDLGAPQTDSLGNTPIRDIGRAKHPQMVATVVEQFAGGTSVQFQIVSATAADLTTGQVIHTQTAAIPVASLRPGYQAQLDLPPGINQRFLGMRYVVVGTNTTGRVTAGIVADRQTNPTVT